MLLHCPFKCILCWLSEILKFTFAFPDNSKDFLDNSTKFCMLVYFLHLNNINYDLSPNITYILKNNESLKCYNNNAFIKLKKIYIFPRDKCKILVYVVHAIIMDFRKVQGNT